MNPNHLLGLVVAASIGASPSLYAENTITWETFGNIYDQISAVTEIVGGVSFIRSCRDFIPILVKMNFDSRIILNVNTVELSLDTIVSVD